MAQPRAGLAQHVAERLGWQGARSDVARVARHLYRKQMVTGVFQLDEGTLLDGFSKWFVSEILLCLL